MLWDSWPRHLVDLPRAPSQKGGDAQSIYFEGEQEFGDEPSAVCWLRCAEAGDKPSSVCWLRWKRERQAGATDQLGAIVQGAASAISSRALGAIALQRPERGRPFDVIKDFCQVAYGWPDSYDPV